MAHQWQGVIPEYRDRLPFTESDPVVTLGEGGTPLVHAKALDARTGATVYVKVEGMNPSDHRLSRRRPRGPARGTGGPGRAAAWPRACRPLTAEATTT